MDYLFLKKSLDTRDVISHKAAKRRSREHRRLVFVFRLLSYMFENHFRSFSVSYGADLVYRCVSNRLEQIQIK